jgi:hypothetical protein
VVTIDRNAHIDCENVPQDLIRAYKWYVLAEKSAVYDNDKKYLAAVLPRIRARLSGEQRSAGEREAAAWQPDPEACKPRRLL